MALGNKNKKAERLATAHQWVEEGGAGGDFTVLNVPKGVSIWAPKEEKVYNVTVVPYEVTDAIKPFSKKMAAPGQLYYERSFQVHGQVGPEGSKRSYVCAAGTFGKKCAICEYRNKLSAPDNDPDTIKLIKDLRQKDRQIWNVLVHEEKQKGVQLWEVSWHLFGTFLQEKLKKAEPEKRERYMRFHDPERGYDFRLSPREKQMGQYKFLEFYDIEFKRRKEPLSDDLINKATDLDSVIKETPYEKLKEIIMGGAAPDDEPEDEEEEDDDQDDEEEEKPKKKVKAKAGKKKAKPDPDEDDDDAEQEEDEDDGDGEEDEAEEEDDEDEGEDEGEDEDAEGDDDSDDEDDDGDEEDVEYAPAAGDRVTWKIGKKVRVGKVIKTNPKKGEATIRVKGDTHPHLVDMEILEPAPTAVKKAPPVLDDDEEDEEEVVVKPKKKTKIKVKNKKPGRNDPF